MAKASQPMSIDPVLYRPVIARMVFTPKEARAEYSRLRKIASKRLQRLGAAFPESQTYQRYKNSAQPLPRTATEGQIYKALYDAAHFLSLQASTVTGQRAARKAAIQALQEQGYSNIDETNFSNFENYMRSAREYYGNAFNSKSEEIVDLFNDAAEKGVDPELLLDDLEDFIEGGIPDEFIPDNDEEELEDIEDMRRRERSQDRQPELIPGERDPERRRTRMTVTPAQKRAQKNAQRAKDRKRQADRKKNRKKKSRRK